MGDDDHLETRLSSKCVTIRISLLYSTIAEMLNLCCQQTYGRKYGGSQKFRGAGTPPSWDRCPPRNTPSSTCYVAKCGRSSSNGTNVGIEIHQKWASPRISPFKVIGIDTDRSTAYDFL